MGARCICCPIRRLPRSHDYLSRDSDHYQSPDSDGWGKSPIQRMHSKMQLGGSVLHRGFGEFSPDTTGGVRVRSFCKWYWKSTILLILAAMVTIPASLAIDFNAAVDGFKDDWKAIVFKLDSEGRPDRWALASAMRRLVAIPLTCAAINFLIQHIRHTTFWWERKKPARRCYDPLACWLMLLASLFLVQSACVQCIKDDISSRLAFDIQIVITTVVLRGYFFLLDSIDAMMRGMVREQEIINSTSPVQKMQNLVRNISRTGKPEKDYVYCFAQANTVPAEVLSYIWSVYYIIGKVAGAAIALGVYLGVDEQQIANWIFGSIAFSAATASGFMFELGPNTLSLFRLALNKPFYVGDLVTLNSNGAMDAGSSSIMGFVENITMMYVVIRNFEMKQTWISHKTFSNLIIQNWTRRPSKTVLLFIGISSRCSVKRVAKLQEFGKRWIQASPEIQQTNYQKCHIVATGQGYTIEVIFFPAIGVTHRGIRQKFLIAFMEAGERLKIPFVPTSIAFNFCDAQQHAHTVDDLERGDIEADQSKPFAAPDLEDLLPDHDDLLPQKTMMPTAVPKRWLREGDIV